MTVLLETEYAVSHPIQIAVLTWNIDSRKPSDLESGDSEDRNVLIDFLSNNPQSSVFIFNFQELVDLESVTSFYLLIEKRKCKYSIL